ncbi:hypothetical protein EYF80_023917 [Liparis tanakae]|uniref:Uncharacterized protein n=1 Tax=Liparis tanakae TaxID=230148 RepID=A0A4Z2HJG7_9TELE|nr:hypothetical protein EYF80_023917 [Liparis tanakae]
MESSWSFFCSTSSTMLFHLALKPTTKGIVSYNPAGLPCAATATNPSASPVCHHLHILQSLWDLHLVQPLLLLVNPQLAGVDLAEHAVDGEGIVEPLLSEHRHLGHLGVKLLHLSHAHLHLLQSGQRTEERRGDNDGRKDRQHPHVFAESHDMHTMSVNGLADPPVLLQKGLGGVLVVSKVLAGDQAVGILQPRHQVVRLRGELEKVERLLQVAETLRGLVLQPLPLALHLHDALLDARRAKALVTQDLLSSLHGVLQEQDRMEE